MSKIYIRENFKLVHKKNNSSGAEWTEHGQTKSYSVVGPTGILSRCRRIESAQKEKQGWEDYFNKFGWPFIQ